MAHTCDVAVIGGGPAGYIAAVKASKLGAETILVEQDTLGGTCLNRGCIPTKYYAKTAEFIYEAKNSAWRGIVLPEGFSPAVDMKQAVIGKDKTVRKLTSGIAGLLKAHGVQVVKGKGKAVSSSLVEVEGAEPIHCKSVILAGGSKEVQLPIPGLDHPQVYTSAAILDIETVPKRLAVIGGGAIGIEIAVIYHAFGASVDIIELTPSILPFFDAGISETFSGLLKSRGINLHTEGRIEKITPEGDELILELADGSQITADAVLAAAGRQPELSSIPEHLVRTEKGAVQVDPYMETSQPGIFAPGDVNGKCMLAHAAFHMGETAAVNAARRALPALGIERQISDLRYVPSIVYAVPEAASVGMKRAEAEERFEIITGTFPFSANGRAVAHGSPEGYIEVVAEQRYGRILGVHALGPSVSEIIQEAAVLMAMEVTVHELARCIHGHPTVSEALMEAAADAVGECLHLPPKQ